MKAERRAAERQKVHPLKVTNFTSLDHMTLLSRNGHIVNASVTGFLLELSRKDIVPKELREGLSLEMLKGDKVLLRLEEMNLEISGTIARTQRSKDKYRIAIDFSDDAPEFWRECLMDLLPRPGEIDK